MKAENGPALNVSRETLEQLNHYHDLLLKWNRRINLISRSTDTEIWERHIWDSAQVFGLAPPAPLWLDIGSGGGFPGLVVAILAKASDSTQHVTLVESDQRKSAFLRTVIRDLSLPADVVVDRIEKLSGFSADVTSARALAELTRLLGYAERHLSPNGTALFMKGENWQNEVEIARKTWSFEMEIHPSRTNPNAVILEIKELERV